MGRWVGQVAAGLASIALVGGMSACGSASQKAGVGETSSSTEKASKKTRTPTPSPSYVPASSKGPAQNVPKPGPMPKLAKEKSEAGQVAFLQYWEKQFNYSKDVQKFGPEFWEITARGCEVCAIAHNRLAALRKEDEQAWLVGANISLTNVEPSLSERAGKTYIVYLTFSEEGEEVFTPKSTVAVASQKGGSVERAVAFLSFSADGWKVEEFSNDDS